MGVLLGDWEQGVLYKEPQVLRPPALALHCHLVVGIDHCCSYLLSLWPSESSHAFPSLVSGLSTTSLSSMCL